jgi:Protein of unknown function (DUF3108)
MMITFPGYRASAERAQSADPSASTSQLEASGSQPMAHTVLAGELRYGNCTWINMARKTLFALLGACALSIGYAQGSAQGQPAETPDAVSSLRTLNHNAFKPGEKLEYVLHYGFMNAGVATVQLKENPVDMLGRKVLYASAEGHSTGAFKAFYKVNDLYESRFDAKGVFPWVFTRRVDEGGYTINQDYTFLQHRNKVSTQDKKTFDVPANAQDMISAFYYARTWDLTNVQPGQEFSMDVFIDNEIWPLRMRYIGKETVSIRNGKYRCLKFQPMVQKGRIFKSNEDLNVWVTDDANRIPVLVQAKILVGSIKMELSGYSGLANPIAKL